MATKAPGDNMKSWASLSKVEQRQIMMHLESLKDSQPVKPQKTAKGTFNLKGYVRCELSAADKDAFKLWEDVQSDAAMYDALVKAVDSGYMLKAGEGKESYQATLSAADTGQDWDGYVLTAFASSPGRALALLVYKHSVLMQQDWSAWMTEGGEDFIR